MRKTLLLIASATAMFLLLTAESSDCSGSASTNGGSSSPAAADNNSPAAQASTAPQPHTPVTLLDLQGSGTKETNKFTAASDWDLTWSYDCSSFGSQGNFVVDVYDSDGSLDLDNEGVNQLGNKGNDVQHYHKGGTFYLSIDSECSWHVTATG